MTHRTLFPPPDEKRALEQLERLHREILRARRDRDRAGADFEGFVEEFRSRPQEGGAAPASERPGRRAPRAIVPSLDRSRGTEEAAESGVVTKRRSTLQLTPDSPTVSSSSAAEPERTDTFSAMAAPGRGAGRRLLLVTATVLLIGAAAAFYFWQRAPQGAAEQQVAPATAAAPSRETAPPPSTPSPSTSVAPSTSVPSAPATEAPRAAEPPVSPSTVQLTTDRAVWMRVIVDGQKVLEREVPAGQRLTYTPAESIVIRAGDAGGVRVKVGTGAEAVLGRDAFPLTRRITVPRE